MDESEFNKVADAALARVEQAIEQCGADLDIETKPGGVIEVEFADGSKIIINRHTAAREIWLAARSGGYHFRPTETTTGRNWISARDGQTLAEVLAQCMLEQGGSDVVLEL